jgi:hypothetical protein
MSTIKNIEFHRNGVGGDSFYVVEFNESDTGRDLVAVIASEMRYDDSEYRCYVIDPSDPVNSKWRGDTIYRDLVDAGLWDILQAKQDDFMRTLAAAR